MPHRRKLLQDNAHDSDLCNLKYTSRQRVFLELQDLRKRSKDRLPPSTRQPAGFLLLCEAADLARASYCLYLDSPKSKRQLASQSHAEGGTFKQKPTKRIHFNVDASRPPTNVTKLAAIAR